MTSAETTFWETSAGAATTVPAVGIEAEAWIARNLCEFALALEVADAPVALLDDLVSRNELGRAPSRFAERLRGLRARRGDVPDSYPNGLGTPSNPNWAGRKLISSAAVLLEFAAELADIGDVGPMESAHGGRGEAAVAARAAWRPFPEPAKPVAFIDLDIPADLMWRAWTVLPGIGAIRVVNDEQLTPANFDIWWGVHDGSHLDHLAMFPMDSPSPIAFGTGLIATESLIMSLELLAAAEALGMENPGAQASVRAGILERVGRISDVFTNPTLKPTVERLALTREVEFPSIPTIASAYVQGPLDMIENSFRHPLVPESVAATVRARWAAIENAHPAITALLAGARTGRCHD